MLQPTLQKAISLWRVCLCALTAFSNDTSPATAPNKPQGSHYAVLKIRDQTLDCLPCLYSRLIERLLTSKALL